MYDNEISRRTTGITARNCRSRFLIDRVPSPRANRDRPVIPPPPPIGGGGGGIRFTRRSTRIRNCLVYPPIVRPYQCDPDKREKIPFRIVRIVLRPRDPDFARFRLSIRPTTTDESSDQRLPNLSPPFSNQSSDGVGANKIGQVDRGGRSGSGKKNFASFAQEQHAPIDRCDRMRERMGE